MKKNYTIFRWLSNQHDRVKATCVKVLLLHDDGDWIASEHLYCIFS